MTKDDIKDMFPAEVYRRGHRYYQEGRVQIIDYFGNNWITNVRGSKSYKVLIQEDGDVIETNCSCPAFEKYWNPCKHVAAALLEIYERESRNSSRLTSSQLFEERRKKEQERRQLYEEQRLKNLTNHFIRVFANEQQKNAVAGSHQRQLLTVEWILKIHTHYSVKDHLTLEMKLGPKRIYVLRKIKDLLRAVNKKEPFIFTKTFAYEPLQHAFHTEDMEIIEILQRIVKHEDDYEQFQPVFSMSSGSADGRALKIPSMMVDELLIKLEKVDCHFENGNEQFDKISVETSELPFTMELGKSQLGRFQLDFSNYMTATFLDFYGYLVNGNIFYKLTPTQITLMQELKNWRIQAKNTIMTIDSDQIEPFMSNVVPSLDRNAKLTIDKKVSSQIAKFPLEAKMFVDREDDKLHVTLEYHYGEHTIHPFQKEKPASSGPILIRDMEKEQRMMDVLEATPLQFNGKVLHIEGEEEIYDFLFRTVPQLEGIVDIFLTNAVKSLILPDKAAPETNIDIDSTGNLLEVSFDMEGIDEKEIANILRYAIEKKRFYRLPSGAFVSLETEEFQAVQHIFREFKPHPSQLTENSIRLPLYRGMQMSEVTEGDKVKYGKHFRRLLNRLKHPEELEFDLPEGLQAELRDYQQSGFQWLKTLSYYRFGGILADDMGLGKTLQSIAFILSEKGRNDVGPSLIVAPASLVYNWRNEFRKFAPSLKVEVLVGTPQERMEFMKSAAEADVWITSYPTLRQDIEEYKPKEFNAFILDEAQAIKNSATKTAKAVREIRAVTRFALSGTPIENSMDELWSIFQTIMPDFFPSLKDFRQIPPEKVAKMVQPFILRRLKKDVLKELPEKIETVHYSELTKQQKELYLAYLEQIKTETIDSLEGEGFQKSRMKILAGLTRLRQLCCHPSLFLEDYQGDSGKLDQLMEIVSTALANGKRPLIFSQFTSMLEIMQESFRKTGVKFFYLDGQTKPKDRVEMVDQFNEGEGDLFLISLKAGNTGFNLTGADTVILYDLWWNPAVEEQAAGRAHRMGQKNVVQVIRLITEGTIEEKIYELQQNKKELIDTVIQPGEQNITTMTEQEIREILNI